MYIVALARARGIYIYMHICVYVYIYIYMYILVCINHEYINACVVALARARGNPNRLIWRGGPLVLG